MAWVRRNCRQLVSVCRDRRRWDPVALEDPADRRGADAVAEFEQLALDPHVSPARVLPRHPHDQRGEDVVDRWPSGPVRVGPSSAHEAAMPAQDGARGDQAMATQCSGQPPDEGGEDGPVRPVQAWSGVGAAEHGDLMPQHEELDVLGGGRAAHQQDQSEHLLEDQIQQPQRHGGDHAQPPTVDHRWSAAVRRVLEPHRLGPAVFAAVIRRLPTVVLQLRPRQPRSRLGQGFVHRRLPTRHEKLVEHGVGALQPVDPGGLLA